jgi:hypothetical protein
VSTRGRAAALGAALAFVLVLVDLGSARAGETARGQRRMLLGHARVGGPAGQGASVPRTIGPAGPPPLGAAGPPPLGAAGPPPLGAGGPPPLTATGVVFPEDPRSRLHRHRHRPAVSCCFDDPAGAPVDEAAPAPPTSEASDPLD